MRKLKQTGFLRKTLSRANRGGNMIATVFATILLAFCCSTQPLYAANADEVEEGQWESIGMGKLVDGWVLGAYSSSAYEANPLPVEIQQNKANKSKFRVWNPYNSENLETIKSLVSSSYANQIQESEYAGQIVFDISNPDYVVVGSEYPSGWWKFDTQMGVSGLFPGETIFMNFHYWYKRQGAPDSWIQGNITEKTTYADGVVYIEKSQIADPEFISFFSTNKPSYIYLPEGFSFDPDAIDEEEAGQWESIGMGTLVDGWVTDGKEFSVEIQQNVNRPTLYRVWEPYKDLEAVAGMKNDSRYHGQIVFDITHPDCVLISYGKPIGYYSENDANGYTGEMYACNQLSYLFKRNGLEEDVDYADFMDFAKRSMGSYTATYADGEVTLAVAQYFPKAYADSAPYEGFGPVTIRLPKELSEEEQWELEAGQWESVGMGTLVDGWVTDGERFDVEIQRSVTNENRYRVWNPYKELEAKTGKQTDSKYKGQIVFDVTDPECVRIEYGKPIGYSYNGEKYSGEMYALDYYGYYYQFMGGAANEAMAEMAKNMAKGNEPTTYANGVVTIQNARHISADFQTNTGAQMVSEGRTAQIVMPKNPGDWTIVCDADYFTFTIDGEQTEAAYDEASNSYTFANVKDPITLVASLKPEYVSYLVNGVEISPVGGVCEIVDRGKGFSIKQTEFTGKYTFNVQVSEVVTSWEFEAEDDYFDITVADAEEAVTYDADTKTYRISEVAENATVSVRLKDTVEGYRIVSVDYEQKPAVSVAALAAAANAMNADVTIDEDGQGFTMKMADYVGAYRFIINYEYAGPMIRNVAVATVSPTQQTASIRINYDSTLVPEGATIKAYYSDGEVDTETCPNVADGRASGVDILVTGLSADTEYTYNMVVVVYDAQGEELSRTNNIKITFRTSKAPTVDADVTAADYLWDTTRAENTYGIYSFCAYNMDEGENKGEMVNPGFKPLLEAVRSKYFTKTHENGVREMTILLAHMLQNPSLVTDDEEIIVRNRFFIMKNPIGDVSAIETLYMPTSPDGWDDENGNNPYAKLVENGVRCEGLSKVDMKLNSGNGSGWDVERLNYFHLNTSEKVYNVVVTIGFDENDDAYETPTYIKVDYQEEPMTALIGTIAQTSPLYDSEKDKVGGWNTWVPLVSNGDEENPYPYVYDFIAQEETYDLSFTFDNNRLFDILGKDGVYPGFYLQEIYPHNMAWNAGFETPKSWNSKTRGREVKPGQTNYYPGYIGPYETGREGYEPEKIESIELTNLTPGKHYQLRIEHPSYGWETDPNNQSFTYIDNALGYITLVDPVLGENKIDAYQLVKDTKNEGVYYTYDLKDTGLTFKVKIDSDDKVLSYEPVTVDEKEVYKDARYQFTEKIFVYTSTDDYVEVNENGVVVKVLDVHADLIFEEGDETISTKTVTSAAFSMEGIDNPLAAKHFDVDNFLLTYQRGYYTCPDNTLELFVTDRPVTHQLIWQYQNGTPKEPRLFDAETVELNKVSTTSTLVIPEPKEDLTTPITYDLTAESAVTGDEENTVELRFYADDLRGGNDYLKWDYKLPSSGALHSHDYHVTYPYLPSNVTPELGAIMKEEGRIFTLEIKDEDADPTKTQVDVDPTVANPSQPGFFNADLGYIFDKVINQSAGVATREMGLKEYSYDNVFKRWDSNETAKVELDLNAPIFGEVEENPSQELDSEGNPVKTRVAYAHVENYTTHDGETLSALAVPGFTVENTQDAISETASNNLLTGDDADGYTTLYLVEFDAPLHSNGRTYEEEAYKLLMTSEEMRDYHMPVFVFEADYDMGLDAQQASSGTIAIPEPVLDMTYSFRVRNVYLFPVDNDGFRTPDELSAADDEAVQSVRRAAVAEASTTNNVYHAVTTPILEHTLILVANSWTSIETMPEDAVQVIARVENGAVEVLADDAKLYSTSGYLVGEGTGVYPVSAGVYIVTSGDKTVKLVVK